MADKARKRESEESGTKKVKLIRRLSDDVSVYYTNDVIVAHTDWDVQITFGQFVMPTILKDMPPDDIPDEIAIKQDLVVTMSYPKARRFYDALGEHLARLNDPDAEDSATPSA